MPEMSPKDKARMVEAARTAQELRSRADMESAELRAKEFVATGKSLLVKVRMTGDGFVKGIQIDPDYLATHTSEEISEDIVAALNKCRTTIDAQMNDISSRLSRGLQEAMVKAYEKGLENNDDGSDR